MTEMEMSLKLIDSIEKLSPQDFVKLYNKQFNSSLTVEQIKWNGFPVYYDPDD